MDRFGSHHKFALWSQTLVFFKPAYRLASHLLVFFILARLCSHHSFFLNHLTMNAAKTLVFFVKPRNKKFKKLVKWSSEK